MTKAARPDFGPSLTQLLGPRLRALGPRGRFLVWAAVALVVLAALALLIHTEAANQTYTQTKGDASARGLAPLPFHFDHTGALKISKPAGSYVQAQEIRDGTLVARFRVTPFSMKPQTGLVSGYMPILAIRIEREAAHTYHHFRLQFEGRSRVNEVEGYQFAFTARLLRSGAPPRQLFGRVAILPEPYDPSAPDKPYPAGRAPDRGLTITMLTTTLDDAPTAVQVGDAGILQKPFRSFRFGTS